MSRQAVSDALKKLKDGEQDVWVTINGRRYKIGLADPQTFAGGAVILATSRGYEVVELFKRKGPHEGLDRWQVQSSRKRAYWAGSKQIRALVLDGHAR